MGFRYIEVPDTVLFEKRFGMSIENILPETLKRWRKKNCVQTEKLALNRKGLLFLNSFLIEAFEELNSAFPTGGGSTDSPIV